MQQLMQFNEIEVKSEKLHVMYLTLPFCGVPLLQHCWNPICVFFFSLFNFSSSSYFRFDQQHQASFRESPFVWSFSDTRQKKTCHFPCISFHYQACLSRLSFSLCFFLRKSRRLW